MNGYRKMRLVNSNTKVSSRSISMDLSDLMIPSPQTQKPNGEITSTCSETARGGDTRVFKDNNIDIIMNHEQKKKSELGSHIDEEEIGAKGKRSIGGGHVKLSRNCSVSSSTSISQSFRRTSNSTTSIQSAVKRAFSMRRSSSVSERYCRIHDQFVVLEVEEPPSPIHDVDADAQLGTPNNNYNNAIQTEKKISGGRRIFKACRRLLGF